MFTSSWSCLFTRFKRTAQIIYQIILHWWIPVKMLGFKLTLMHPSTHIFNCSRITYDSQWIQVRQTKNVLSTVSWQTSSFAVLTIRIKNTQWTEFEYPSSIWLKILMLGIKNGHIHNLSIKKWVHYPHKKRNAEEDIPGIHIMRLKPSTILTPPPHPKDNLRGTNCCAGTSPALAKAAGCCNCGWSDCAVCDDDVSSSTPALCTAIWISSFVSPETNNTQALCPEHKRYLSFTICNSLNANQVLQSHLKATHIHKVHWEKGWH